MSRTNNEREKFIELIQDTPLISYACKRLRLSRTTIYRWRKTNPEFKEKLDNALEYGRENVNDMAEAMLIQKIQERDMGATKFWLNNNHPKYIPKRTVFVEPPSEIKKPRLGVPCHQCGHTEQKGFDPFDGYKKKPRKQMLKEILEARHQKETSKESFDAFYESAIRHAEKKYAEKLRKLEQQHGPVDLNEPSPGDPPRRYAYE
jgi:hypothetical protein